MAEMKRENIVTISEYKKQRAAQIEKLEAERRHVQCDRVVQRLIAELETAAKKEQRAELAVYRRLGEAARARSKDAPAADLADAEVSEVELFGSAEMSEGEIED